jgi:hypothetical protein
MSLSAEKGLKCLRGRLDRSRILLLLLVVEGIRGVEYGYGMLYQLLFRTALVGAQGHPLLISIVIVE